MSPEIIFFSKYIEKELGIVYSDFNTYQLENRLQEIVRVLGMKDIHELYDTAKKAITGHLKQLLLDIATNNETSFFRDPKAFRGIQKEIFPKLFAKTGGKIRIWSAASSFGQEPYTLAIMVKEYAKANNLPLHNVEILATDISSRALDRAQSGKYSQLEVQRGLAAALMIQYFDKDDQNFWTIKPELRALIKFQKLNLLDSFQSMGKFDLILCRNVLIYQSVPNKSMIIQKLAASLNPDGILLLGSGESMIGLSDSFETIKTAEDVLIFKLKAPKAKAA